MAKSGIQHVVSAVPIPQTTFVSEEFHALIHGTSFPASPVERQLFYRDDLHAWYIYNGTSWVSLQAAAIDELNDIGDVNVPTPAIKQGIEYDTATSKWILTSYMLSKLLAAQGDIITRSATVPKRLALGTEGHYLKAGADEPEWAAVVGANLTSNGSYLGNNTVNRAIAHGLGVKPKVVLIKNLNAGDLRWFWIYTGQDNYIHYLRDDESGGHGPTTAMDATNFYVGVAANYFQSANETDSTYIWVAIG